MPMAKRSSAPSHSGHPSLSPWCRDSRSFRLVDAARADPRPFGPVAEVVAVDDVHAARTVAEHVVAADEQVDLRVTGHVAGREGGLPAKSSPTPSIRMPASASLMSSTITLQSLSMPSQASVAPGLMAGSGHHGRRLHPCSRPRRDPGCRRGRWPWGVPRSPPLISETDWHQKSLLSASSIVAERHRVSCSHRRTLPSRPCIECWRSAPRLGRRDRTRPRHSRG